MRCGIIILFAFAAHSIVAAEFITPGENLVTQGMPQIPYAIEVAASRYGESRSATLFGWHPLRREMLIGTRFADTPQIHRVNAPMGAREQLTFFKDSATAGVFDPVAGKFMVFEKDEGGGERYQLYRYDFDEGNLTLLTDGKSRHSAGAWSAGWGSAYRNLWAHAGDRLAYIRLLASPNGQVTELRVMNPRTPQSDRLVLKLDHTRFSVADWSPNDKQILILEFMSINESYVWLVDVESGAKTLLTPHDQTPTVFYAGAQFSPDGNGLYTVTDKDSEFRRLAYFDLKKHSHRYLSSDIPWDVDEFALSKDGKQLAFTTNENGISELRLMNTQNYLSKRVPMGSPGIVSDLSWRPNSRELGFSISNAQSPNDVFSYNTVNRQLTRWTRSETGGLNAKKFVSPELVRIKSFDGVEISGFLYRPSKRFQGPRPVMIQFHGGPEAQSRPYYLARLNYLIDELGVALFFPNIRGSTGYGKTFSLLDNGLKRADAYRDVESLLNWIGTQKNLDANRVMVTGASYGGHMTLVTSMLYADRIRCALSVVGISNLRTFLENTESYRRDARRVEYGDERLPEVYDWMQKMAPLNHAKQITKPLFVVQGFNDPRVPVSEAVQIVETMRQQGAPAWYLLAKDEGHGFRKKKNNDFLFDATVQFMKDFLLNDDLPAKPQTKPLTSREESSKNGR